MKLNADIIFDRLSEMIPAEITGYRDAGLTVGRPEFYLDENDNFLAGHLYILRSETISRRAAAEKGAVLVCIGDIPQMAYFHDRCCFIKLGSHANLLQVFNCLQKIFDFFDNWSQRLISIADQNISPLEMAEASLPVFKNPILILDSGFKVVAQTGFPDSGPSDDGFRSIEADELSVEALGKYMQQWDPLLNQHEPLLLTTMGVTTLSANFFDGQEYAGSITIEYLKTCHRPGDDALLLYLSLFISRAVKRNASLSTSERSMLKRFFQTIVQGLPVDTSLRHYLERIRESRRFICAFIQANHRFAQIPPAYICSKFSSLFPKSTTFEYRSNIVSYIEGDWDADHSVSIEELIQKIELLADAMDLKVGLSGWFTDPYQARLYYAQAHAALENGTLSDPEKKCFSFDEYALMELILNAQKDLPLEMYFPEGLQRLFSHDKKSPTSYVDTLHVYLDHNMNITRTASALYIHRSTLIERLARIERELGEDLNDPDVRLRILILLKAIDIQKSVHGE